jgi:tRNA modification GTPase
LRAELARRAGSDAEAGTFSARARHVHALERVARHLARGATELAEQRAGELLAEELRLAQDALGEITGRYTPDDLLGRIFSSFCIGK